VPDIEISDKTVMNRLAGNMAYLRQKTYALKEALDAAARRLIDAGFPGHRVNAVFAPRNTDTAQEIVGHAVKGRFTDIVLNHHPGKIRKYFTTSISRKVARELADKKLHVVG
jgi:hypothetical protein